eukprot:m.175478 g.175478  ORF g.175478 m.175478 type:complete len:355 (-) comp31822_c0_seq1:253-1317(-)
MLSRCVCAPISKQIHARLFNISHAHIPALRLQLAVFPKSFRIFSSSVTSPFAQFQSNFAPVCRELCGDSKMSGIKNSASVGSPVSQVVQKLEELFPLELAEKWDNVGVLIDCADQKSKCQVFLTNDLTETVLDEAIAHGSDLIISYHPTPFRATKKLLYSNTADRIVLKCITNKIAVFSPHTACDNAHGGVNDWLINGLTLEGAVEPIEALPLPNSGRGRIIKLTKTATLGSIVSATKNLVKLEKLRIAFAAELLTKHDSTDEMLMQPMSSVAVQAGSGASVLAGCTADVWISGEMSHHEMLAATAAGTTVILTEHSNSERGFLSHLAQTLVSSLNNVATFHVSNVDADPVIIL